MGRKLGFPRKGPVGKLSGFGKSSIYCAISGCLLPELMSYLSLQMSLLHRFLVHRVWERESPCWGGCLARKGPRGVRQVLE